MELFIHVSLHLSFPFGLLSQERVNRNCSFSGIQVIYFLTHVNDTPFLDRKVKVQCHTGLLIFESVPHWFNFTVYNV